MESFEAQGRSRVQRMNRMVGWLILGIQLSVLSIPFLLALTRRAEVDIGSVRGTYYFFYIWFGFPFVTLFMAWLFMRSGAFRTGGRSWWGLFASLATLLLWSIVCICHTEGIGVGGCWCHGVPH
jgi:hypothetical protein